MMVEEGARVRLRRGSAIARQHAGLLDAIGIVGAIVEGRRWHRLDASDDERLRDRAAHVRFKQPPVVLMAVLIGDLELVDRLDPALSAD